MRSYIDLRDEGMRPLEVEIKDFNGMVETLVKYNTDFTRAFVYLHGKQVAYANRAIGSREWNIRLVVYHENSFPRL